MRFLILDGNLDEILYYKILLHTQLKEEDNCEKREEKIVWQFNIEYLEKKISL